MTTISPSNFDEALIDADILVYRVGFTTEQEEEGIAKWRLDELAERIMKTVNVEKATFFITSTDKSNFRFGLFPDYKANRKDKPKPKHYDFLRNLLLEEYGAQEVFGMEADDALGIQMSRRKNAVLCSIDKDLDQIPGWHYNFVTDRLYNISEIEAMRCFYTQVLVGDATDNVDGCPKIGKVKAQRMLEGCQDEDEMFETVRSEYENAYPENWQEKLHLAGELLWVRRFVGQGWARNSGSPILKEILLNSLSPLESATSTSQTSSST